MPPPPRQIFFRWDFFLLRRRSTLAALAALPARSEELIFLMELRPVSDAEVQQQQNEDNIQRPFQELSQFLSFSRQIKRFFHATSPFRNVILGVNPVPGHWHSCLTSCPAAAAAIASFLPLQAAAPRTKRNRKEGKLSLCP